MNDLSLFGSMAGSGGVASRLLAEGMHVNALRPYKAKWNDAESYIAVGDKPKRIHANATLTYDEWVEIDSTVKLAASARLVGVQDLIDAGLVYNLKNGLATTVLQSQTGGDMSPAELSMAGDKPGVKDRLAYETVALPLPIAHKDFELGVRVLQASRINGNGLDLDTAEVAGRKVAELVEDLLFNGTGSYTFGGGTIYGYANAPSANTVTLGTQWDNGATGAAILATVLDMKAASIAANHYGPWILYVPTAYDSPLDDDFKADVSGTIRQRILMIDGITAVKVSDKLAANKVILVEMQSETVRLVQGLPITTVEWDSFGGMRFEYKVMAIQIPQVRATHGSKSGITVAS